MSADKIEITYAVFLARRGLYAEWDRGGDGAGGTAIPDDVRVALALLVAPGLVEAVTKAPEPPIKPAPDTRGQDTVSDSRNMREGNKP